MFYVIEDGMARACEMEDWGDYPGVGYVTLPELREHWKQINIPQEIPREIEARQQSAFRGLRMCAGMAVGILELLNSRRIQEPGGRLALLLRQELFLVVELEDPQQQFSGSFQHLLEEPGHQQTVAQVVYEYLDGFLQENAGALGKIQQIILDMERRLVEGKMDQNLNGRIFSLRRQLTTRKQYARQFANIGAALAKNEDKMFWQEEFPYFKLYVEQAEELERQALQLCEDLIHVREALDAALNYNLNSVMKLFTVITTIFMPLTLITGWYGMNFTKMPELTWDYGYPAVIGAAVLVVILCLLFFKWKKLL